VVVEGELAMVKENCVLRILTHIGSSASKEKMAVAEETTGEQDLLFLFWVTPDETMKIMQSLASVEGSEERQLIVGLVCHLHGRI